MTELTFVSVILEEPSLIRTGPLTLDWAMGSKGEPFWLGSTESRVEVRDALPSTPLNRIDALTLSRMIQRGIVITGLGLTSDIARGTVNCIAATGGGSEILHIYLPSIALTVLGTTLSMIPRSDVFVPAIHTLTNFFFPNQNP